MARRAQIQANMVLLTDRIPIVRSYTMHSPAPAFSLRKATPADRPELELLISQSARGLSREDYTQRQIEAALGTAFGVDGELIRDGTYFVAAAGAVLVGCGGWSRRKTLFGGDRQAGRASDLLDPVHDAARIRAFFVRPDSSSSSCPCKSGLRPVEVPLAPG
jgi:hypothetical protein